MPLVRYDLKSEFRMANPELYQSVSKHDAEALFESITMAALAGIVRQLGEVAELGAEIFGDLHEEVLGLSSRGRRLAIRVEQLEAKLPAVEKSVSSETDQLRFAFTQGIDWHPNICEKQNQFGSQEELPHFIQSKYDECREPPRFYLVDSFDVAGPGASLRRYTDPSFFRTEWASCELLRAEKAFGGRRTPGNKKERRSELCNSKALSKNGVSLLQASKYIHSVDVFKDPYLENGEHSSSSSATMETLRISAMEIEAGSLLRKKIRYPPASDSDPAIFADSPEQFVDALTSMEPEAPPESKEMKLESDVSRPTSSGSNHADSLEDSARDMAKLSAVNSYKKTNGLEDSQGKGDIVHRFQETTELSFYSSSSTSELSSPTSVHHSPSSSAVSDDAYSQAPAFSLLDSPMSHVERKNSTPIGKCMLFSPGSPTEFDEPAPPLPPLPPSKWMLTTTNGVPMAALPAKVEDEEEVVTSERHDSLMDSIVSHDKENLRKVNGDTRARSFDSREVLLEQIRSKSFNLKHTEVQDKADPAPAPPASGNVTAILEKASAIRQALEDSDYDDDFK